MGGPGSGRHPEGAGGTGGDSGAKLKELVRRQKAAKVNYNSAIVQKKMKQQQAHEKKFGKI